MPVFDFNIEQEYKKKRWYLPLPLFLATRGLLQKKELDSQKEKYRMK